MRATLWFLIAVATTVVTAPCPTARADQALDARQLVEIAVEMNPQVKSMRAQWLAAIHSIKQNYAPADPIFSYFNIDSPQNPFAGATEQSFAAFQSFQFPGEAILQADQARRSAEIAQLAYEATVRDLRAQVETAYYQTVLDDALWQVGAQLLTNLAQAMKVAQVAYSANQVTQTDFITAEFNLTNQRLAQDQLRSGRANDRTNLNQLLYRAPDAPLNLDETLKPVALETPVDQLIDRAARLRQEILETALTEKNNATALTLAKMEYLPNYTVGYEFDHFTVASAAPIATALQDHSIFFSVNVPIFFWIKQREDVTRANYDLEAARDNTLGIRNQTAAMVTTLYRTAQTSYRSAMVERDTLIPLARQNFRVALVAYQGGKIDFVTLSAALQSAFNARVAYLQSINQFLAAEVALEQAIGAPLPR